MIDEDVIQLRPFSIDLIIRGFQTKQIDNADKAYQELESANDIDLVLLDIMLATESKENSRYSRESTRDFIKTGLLLLDDLINVNPNFFPKNVVIFSMGSQDWLVREISKTSSDHNIPYLRKHDFRSPVEFGDKIEQIINGLRQHNDHI